MANRSYKQFFYSQERMPVMLMGAFQQDGDAGDYASLVDNGITYTADAFGESGNDISIEIVGGGTAGAEVVTVVGNAISIEIESTVSTRTQVKTAIDASAPASALISVAVSSGATAASLLAETNLAGGAETVFISNAKDMTLTQLSPGLFQLELQDPFYALLYANASLQMEVAADASPVIQSSDVVEDQQIVIRVESSVQALVDLEDEDIMFVQLILRNSGS